jgi:LuxR family maltose regulon positive regulatory protein
LQYLEHTNLYLVPLDNDRRWYRYHHLFADLIRQRLSTASQTKNQECRVDELHKRASEWFEANGLEIDAFQHAAAANDFERAERLIEGRGMPLHFRGAVAPVLNWLSSLPPPVLDAWPSLWTSYASTLLVTGQISRVEPALQAAEAALEGAEPNEKNRDIVGRIAAIRSTTAATQNKIETIIAESNRALEYLHPNNLAFRTSTIWKLGYAYYLQGNRVAARQAYSEVISIGNATKNVVFTLMARIGLGNLQEAENHLDLAEQEYQRVLQSFEDQPLPFASEAHLGLARVFYEWNDLENSQQHAEQGIELALQVENTDRVVACKVFLARLRLAHGDAAGAAEILTTAAQFAHQHNFMYRMTEVAAAQVVTLLHQGNLAAAAELVKKHDLPISKARVHLADRDASKALAVLEPLREQTETKGWEDERLRVMVLQAIAQHAELDSEKALKLLGDALSLAHPGGFIRIFVDEGKPMRRLLSEAAAHGVMPAYVSKLLHAFEAEEQKRAVNSLPPRVQPLVEPLSERELEVLRLIAQGLSNREISEKLFLALITVKGHNQRIFGKLQVQRRTQAVARARELGLL